MRRLARSFGLCLAATAVMACRYDFMHPGEACGSCHSSAGEAAAFGVAGTAYDDRGVALDRSRLAITDARGRSVALETNAVGNFFTREPLTPPLRVILSKGDASASTAAAPSGDCNSCHASRATAAGRITLSTTRR